VGILVQGGSRQHANDPSGAGYLACEDWGVPMAKVAAFYSVNEVKKPEKDRVHHNESQCAPGRDIKAAKEDKPGTGGYPLCKDCQKY
jgi:hypothetical protein